MKKILFFCIFVLLTGCASRSSGTPDFYLTRSAKATLPTPGITETIELQQLLTMRMKQQTLTVMALLRIDPQGLTVIGLTPVGIKLFQISYDAQGIRTEQFLPNFTMPKANQILADIMLAIYPIATWQNHLPAQWRLADEGNYRILRDDKGTRITVIEYQVTEEQRIPVLIQQKYFGYEFSLMNLSE